MYNFGTVTYVPTSQDAMDLRFNVQGTKALYLLQYVH
jgi:hypothetical protein